VDFRFICEYFDTPVFVRGCAAIDKLGMMRTPVE